MNKHSNDKMEGVNWNVPGKELDQLIRKWVVKRLWEEDLAQYETLRKTLG